MKKRIVALAAAAALASLALAGCGAGGDDAQQAGSAANEAVSVETTEDTAAAAPGEAAGFTEYPVENADGAFEDVEVGFLNVSAVFFQPVPMSNGNEDIDPFDIHLEADVSALENDLGFGAGDWVPYMTVDYLVTAEDGSTAAEGSFMTMSASDGPHYGANIALPDAGTYDLTLTFHNPEENGYLLHTDAATGPGGTFDTYFADGNLSYTFEGWEYPGPVEP